MDKNLYDKQPVKVQNKSGFDKSYQNLYTAKVGSIIPIMVDEVIPNTTVNLDAAITAQLPPLASDTFMRCQLKYASFFVPTRILVKGYEDWLTNQDETMRIPKIQFPMNTMSKNKKKAKMGPGSLADYLGLKMTEDSLNYTGGTLTVNALPFLAYHKIYDDWFRNSLVQRSIYVTPTEYNQLSDVNARYFNASKVNRLAPTSTKGYIFNADTDDISNKNGSVIFADGHDLLNVRQANFDIDLFTSCQPNAQNGHAALVNISDESDFTISELRAANTLQMFLERNNIAGNRMVDYVKAHYGANLSDGVAQRAVLLGSGSFDVYSKGIAQTSNQDTEYVTNSMNPFNTSVGAEYGSASANGKGGLIHSFTAQEPGYIMVLAWLSPKVSYSTGISPILNRYLSLAGPAAQITDMANPTLQNVGNEAVYAAYFDAESVKDANRTSKIFGYNDRYCTWKDKTDEVHGLLRDGQSLQSFALQRTFEDGDNPTISSEFLKIPTDYLDQVSAINGSISQYGYWADTYFDYKVSMPLARYSTPSLQDPAEEHGDTVMLPKGGTHIA